MSTRKIPLLAKGYQGRSRAADSQRRFNVFAEYDQGSPRAPVALYGRPGLVARGTDLGFGDFRGAVQLGGTLCYVMGQTLLQRDVLTGVTASRGVLLTSSGRISMTASATQLLVVDGVAGYTLTGLTFAVISDPDFPNGARQCAYLDGYFVATGLVNLNVNGRFYLSGLLDATSWSALDFATAESEADALQIAVPYNDQLMLLGSKTAEIWQNTGGVSFPFQRAGNATSRVGTCAPFSAVRVENTIVFLGQSDEGFAVLYQMQGWTPNRISNSMIESQWQSYGTSNVEDAYAYALQLGGHIWYVLQFDTDDGVGATWVYDLTLDEWAQWSTHDVPTNTQKKFIGAGCLFPSGIAGVTDLGATHYVFGSDRRLYGLSLALNTDDGQIIKAIVTTPTVEQGQEQVFHTRLLVDMGTGTTNRAVTMRYSDDGGETWGNELEARFAALGDYGAKIEWFRLGRATNRVYEVSVTDDTPRAFLGGYVEAIRGRF